MDTDYEHKHIVWQPNPGHQYSDQLRLAGYNIRNSQPTSRHLTETEHSYNSHTLHCAGKDGRDRVNSILGTCLEASSTTVESLHTNGIPATVCKFSISDGERVAAHYAAVAAPPSPQATPPSVDGTPPQRQLTIVDPTLEQFESFSFAYHPEVGAEFNTPEDIDTVEISTPGDPLSSIYRPRTVDNDRCPTEIP